jgi:hypothetical protein
VIAGSCAAGRRKDGSSANGGVNLLGAGIVGESGQGRAGEK